MRTGARRTLRDSVRRSEVVYTELRQAILHGTLRPGERLREEELARRLRVSRTPVREAIGRLEAEGLAIALPRRGLAVAEVTPEHVMEIYIVREMLEGAASRLAAKNVTPLEAVQLEELLDRLQDAATRDDTAATEALNRRFHSLIYRVSKNRLIQRILDGLWDDLGRFGVTTFSYPGRKKEVLEEHRAITEAIVAGNEAEAERFTRAHLAAGRDTRLRLLYRNSEATPSQPAATNGRTDQPNAAARHRPAGRRHAGRARG